MKKVLRKIVSEEIAYIFSCPSAFVGVHIFISSVNCPCVVQFH